MSAPPFGQPAPVRATGVARPPTGYPHAVPPPAHPGHLSRRLLPATTQARRLRHLVAVCAWALALALGGLVVGVWAMFTIIGDSAAWFEPTIIVVGLFGLTLTMAAFPTVGHRWLPWTLLGAGTMVLITGAVLTSGAG